MLLAFSDRLNYIELTLDYGQPPEGWDKMPLFRKDIWPLILVCKDQILEVYLFYNAHWQGKSEANRYCSGSSFNITPLGLISQMPPSMLNELEWRSDFGGHLNVLYLINSNSEILAALTRLYQSPGVFCDDSYDDLGLSLVERRHVQQLIRDIPNNNVLLGFGHDGDPVYIFGQSEILRSLNSDI